MSGEDRRIHGCEGLPARLQIKQEHYIPNFPIHTITSAPEGSKSALEQPRQMFGVVPNIAGAIANSPNWSTPPWVFQHVHSRGPTEQENRSFFRQTQSRTQVAFHTRLALQQGVSAEETDAIREGRVPADKPFAALSTLAKTLIERRGHLSEQELTSFIAAGFTKEQVMEVIAIAAASTITNYAGTIANPPLEDPFRQYAWRERRDESEIRHAQVCVPTPSRIINERFLSDHD
jgi:hypothetical protein